MSGIRDWMFKARGQGPGPFGGAAPDGASSASGRSGGGGSGGSGGGGGTCMSDGDCGGGKVCRNGTCKAQNAGNSDEPSVDGSAATYQNYQQDMDALTQGIALAGDLSTTGLMGQFLTNRVSPLLKAQYEQWRAANPTVKKNGMLDWMESQQPYGPDGPDWLTANSDAERKKKKKREENKNGTLAPGSAPQNIVDQLYREGIGNYMDLAGFGQGSTRWSGF